MNQPSPLSEQERADLVAYLDGELTGPAAHALEAKLSLHPEARAEAEALRRTWDLLDFLPRPQPSVTFTHRTLQRLPSPGTAAQPRWRRWRPVFLGLGWAATLLLAGLAGYVGFTHLAARNPNEQELVRELRLIENKPLYDLVEDMDFLRHLDQPDLFGDDIHGS